MAAKPAVAAYKISIADAARTDLDDILAWTTSAFGAVGRKRYEVLIQTALTDLLRDPGRIGVRQRSDIGAGICTYHLSTSRKRTKNATQVGNPRHLVFFRFQGKTVQILRLLHDSMDFARHVSNIE
jgi:toxin ParE1/3/4